MKNSEIRELSDKELAARIKEEKNHVTKLQFSHAVSPIDSPVKIRESKKLVARLLTEQKKRVLANVQ
ncbi:MAG: 50S ribosomal protein L29 [Bacteroidia bacterium]|jgi:large subunit ribosomal protein L29|nr:50S ribosomal protein L29 [Bacteroidia bacterium]